MVMFRLAAGITLFTSIVFAGSTSACFTVVVGKDASADGYVIMAHNEDDGPPQVVNHHKVPRKSYAAGEKYKLIGGGQIDQVPETWSYIWSECPGSISPTAS